MFGGDEVQALVMDMGSGTTRLGFAGEDAAKSVFNTAVGAVLQEGPDENKNVRQFRKYYVGHEIYPRSAMEICSPVQHGVVENWEAAEQIWKYAVETHLHTNLKNHPILVSEASYMEQAPREKLAELLFEKFQTPAMFLAKDAVLSTFSLGKSTGLVLDSGAGKTSITPVSDGFVLRSGTTRTKIAGHFIDMVLERELFVNKEKVVEPDYMFKRDWVIDDSKEEGGSLQVTKTNLPVAESFHQYACQQLIRDIKHTVIQLSMDSKVDMNTQIPSVSYELPDGTNLEVGMERFTVPEPLFTPHGIDMKQDLTPNRFEGIVAMANSSVAACDVDLHKELFGNIILSGGTTCMNRFSTRLASALDDKAFKVRIINGNNALAKERLNTVWLGGSILASLGSFHQMWISKAEYEEHGANILLRRCP